MSLKLTPGGVYLFVGRTGSGKTHILQHVASIMGRNFEVCFGFCPTRFAGNMDWIAKERCFEQFDQKKVELILDYQKKEVEAGTAKDVLLVFDDVLGEKTMKLYGDFVTKLSTCCRHYKITIFITAQYLFKVPPVLRENSKFVFICSADNPKEMKFLYDEYCRGLTKDMFMKKLSDCTQNYNVLVIDCFARDSRQCYYSVKAPAKIQPFSL